MSDHRHVTPENGGAACSVSESAFAICQKDIAGEMAKAGRLDIETPFASIRGGTRVGGIGILSLASLFFAATQEAQAAPSDTSFVDDDTIRPRDLTSDYGIIELTTRDGQTILLDSPEYTLVLRRGTGGAITYSQVANSPATMLSYEKDQAGAWHIFSLASGPAANGSNGSSTLFLELPPPTPINFTIPPGQGALNFTLQPLGGANSVLDNFVPLPEHQPPPPQPAVLTPPTIAIDETAGSENGALPVAGVSVANAVSATLTVLNGSLHIDNSNLPPGVTITGDDTNDLVVSGDAAQVNSLLAGLTYTRTGPGDEGTDTLTISVIGTDGTNTTASTTITINPLADPPTAAAPTMLSLSENTTVAVHGVSVGPLAEDSDDTVSATLTVVHGTLHIDNSNLPSGVTVTGDDSNDLMVSGDAAEVNALLAGMTYTPTPKYEGSDTLSLSVTSTDGSNTNATTASALTAITVNPVAEPPTATAPATLTLDENTISAAVSGVSVGPLAEDSDDTVSATLTVAHGTLHIDNSSLPSGVTVTGDDSNDLVVSGDAAKVNALLADLKYTPIAEYEGPDTLNLSVTSTDGNNTFLTPASTSTSIMVEGVADTPIITVTTPSFTTDEDNPIAVTGLSVSPAENNTNDEADTFTAILYVDRGTLTVGNRSGATISGGNGHTLAHSIVISGSLSEVNAALATVHYTPSPADETPDTLHISATTTEESAVGGDTSAPATKTVSIRESDVPAPAEVAGSPLNLALTDPSGAPGRSGDDTLSGGSGDNTFVFKATMDSQPGTSHFDTFTHFVHNPDHIDLTAIAGTTLVEGPVAIADTVAAHTGWFVDNAHNQRIVEVNTTATADHVNLEIHLTGSNINLSGADILHHT